MSPPVTRGSSRLGTGSPAQAAVPPELGVALVAHDDGAELVGARPRGSQLVDREHATVGVAGRVQPHEARLVGPLGRVVGRERTGPGEQRADLVGRVRRSRVHDDVALAEPEHERQQGHELLRADGRQHGCRVETRDAAATRVPRDDRLAELGRADGLRVGVRVGREGEGVAHHVGGRVDRRADGQVDDAALVRLRTLSIGRHEVPRIVGKRPERHTQCTWGGSAAMTGWSFGITPILAAPPGEPMSSKNSTLAL